MSLDGEALRRLPPSNRMMVRSQYASKDVLLTDAIKKQFGGGEKMNKLANKWLETRLGYLRGTYRPSTYL